ncbi:MAG: tail fiber domain-containing protein [Chloroflexota bacterium]
MNHKNLLILIILAAVFAIGVLGAAAQSGSEPSVPQGDGSTMGTSFTYQGQLKDETGNPLNATCDFRFTLWDADDLDGTQIGAESLAPGVSVSEGYFTALVNDSEVFGYDAFRGEPRWLEVGVRCPAGSGPYTALSPRQPLTAVPFASLALYTPWGGLMDMPDGFADGVDNDTTYSAGSGLALAGNQFSVAFGGNGVAATAARSDHLHSNFWRTNGNYQTDPATNFIGTADNAALVFRVNNLTALRLEPNATSPNVIGGYSGNSVAAGVHGATISGGGYNGSINQVTGDYATVGGGASNIAVNTGTVGGGYDNTASGSDATVGGGYYNTAVGVQATVGGGASNQAGDYATVGGGSYNNAAGYAATVSGGYRNEASGFYASVGGGYYNAAAGNYSFVAGRRASNDNADHDGVFLFADSNDADFLSTAANEFAVRASGGVRLRTNSALSTGCNLAAGSGTWACTSDRDAKANFAAVDSRAILAQVAALPITTWNFKTQDASIQHIGPIAQDFYAAFGTGESDTTISMVDADGVALAAIQGLNEIMQEKEAQIAALEVQVAALKEGDNGRYETTSPLFTPWPWLALCIIVLGLAAIFRRGAAGGKRPS